MRVAGPVLGVVFPAQVALDIGLSLLADQLAGMRLEELPVADGVFQVAVLEGSALLLDDVVEPERAVVLADSSEAHGVRAGVILGKTGAPFAGVAEIAAVAQGGLIGAPLAHGVHAAHAAVGVAQGEPGRHGPGLFAQPLHGVEIRTGHWTYSSIGRAAGRLELDAMRNRLEALKSLAEQNPRDNFVRYALAMAYADAGEFERALEEFGVLLSLNPDYKAAYFHAGQALEKLGRLEEARQMYRRGIEVTTRQGDTHAREQLAGALELLG